MHCLSLRCGASPGDLDQMSPDRAARVMELLNDALDRKPSQRGAFLAQACGDDVALREEVQSLITAHERSGSFLDSPIVPNEPAAARSHIGRRIGRYLVHELLAVGGMGVVYRAEQDQPKRTVALKLLRPGLASPRLLKRFDHEAEILGRLNHPGIAKIIEAGTFEADDDVQAYFAMEYIEGQPLHEHVADRQFDRSALLTIMIGICDAVQHAHVNGIVHRDLKPSNVLIDQTGSPRILDFGVARLTEADTSRMTMVTETGQLLGTLAYMSPEQVTGLPNEIDVRSDVYSLGVLAYELLTGQVPHDVANKSIFEAARIIREEPPPRIHVGDMLRGDLETVVFKAMAKEKQRRYQSAGELSEDLRRFLHNEPILARTPSTFYLMRTFARRNRTLVGAAAAVVLALVLGLIGTMYWLNQAIDAQRLAEREADRAIAAERDVQQRLEDLERVASFQEGILEGIDPQIFGATVRELLIENIDSEALPQEFAFTNFTNIGRDLVRASFLEPAVDAARLRFSDQPLVHARLLHQLALSFRNLGFPEIAVELAREALDTRRSELGEAHRDVLSTMSDLATYLRLVPKADEALQWYQLAYEGYRSTVGPHHEDTILTYALLGLTLVEMGDHEQAQPILDDAVQHAETHLGEMHPVTIRAYSIFATNAFVQGDYVQAEHFRRRALETSREVHGPDHTYTVGHAHYLAQTARALGQFDEAERLYREVVDHRRAALGDSHETTLASMISLASVLRAKGDFQSAKTIIQKCVALSRASLGEDHGHTLQMRHSYADILLQLGQTQDAADEYESLLPDMNRVLGTHHSRSITTAYFLAVTLQNLGRMSEAEQYLKQALEGRRQVHGEQHPQTLITMTAMGDLLRELGRLDEAEAIGADAVAAAREVLPAGHWHLGVHLTRHGKTLALMHSFEQAAEAMLEGHEILQASLPPHHAQTETARSAIVELYEAWHEHIPQAGHDVTAHQWRDRPEAEEQPNVASEGM